MRLEAVENFRDFGGYPTAGGRQMKAGQFYRSAAVVADGREPEPFGMDPELYHQPMTLPGAPLPHAWIEHDGRRVSTLDLAGHGRFSLLTGPGGGFGRWRRAADAAGRALGLEIAVHQLADWSALRGVDPSGALLVRPDRHLAWCAQRPDDDTQLLPALSSILGRKAPWPGAEMTADEH